jgi:uncharacterized membrane protein
MRTFMPVGAVGWHLRPRAASTRVLLAALAGEFVFDKLPQTPSRLEPAGLAARAVTSALAGASLSALPGALTATLAALVVAPAAYHARRALGGATGLPDWELGATEDAVAVAVAAAAIRLA